MLEVFCATQRNLLRYIEGLTLRTKLLPRLLPIRLTNTFAVSLGINTLRVKI